MENGGGGGVETPLKRLYGERTDAERSRSSRTVKPAKTALALFFIFFSGSSLMKSYSQGLVQANGADIAYTMRRFGVKMNNPVLSFEVNGSGRFYKNLYVDSLLKAWKIEAFSAELNSLKVTADISSYKLQVSSTVTLDILSGTGNGLVAVDASGELKRYNMTGHSTDVFLGDGTFGNLAGITGWQWYGTDLVSNAQRVVIQRDLAVGGHITIGVTKIISNGSNKDTLRTSKELQIISDAELIDLRADTVRMKDLLEAPRMRTPQLTVSGDASVSGTVNSNEVNANSVTTNNLTTNSTISSPKIITSRITSPDSVIYFGDSTVIIPKNHNMIFGSSYGYEKGISLQFGTARGLHSIAMGFNANTGANAANSVIIGSGPVSGGSITNNIEKSFMVGFNSTIPTLFVGQSNGIVNGVPTTGNVGIATTIPARQLQVDDDVSGISFDGTTATPDAAVIRFGDNTGWKLHFGRSRESNGGTLNTGTTGVLMTIHDNGRVGIGTTSTDAMLTVDATNNSAVTRGIYVETPSGILSEFMNIGSGAGLKMTGQTDLVKLQSTKTSGIADLRIGTTAAPNAVTIIELGKVGVNQIIPEARLHVVETSATETKVWTVKVDANTNKGVLINTTAAATEPMIRMDKDGTTNFLLQANGAFFARAGKVTSGTIPDFVFEPSYYLMPIGELEQYLKKERHLPGFKSAAEIQEEENTIDIGESYSAILQKLEEYALYFVQINKQMIELNQKYEALEKKYNSIMVEKK